MAPIINRFLVRHLNSVEPSIQLTFEGENGRYLRYLDLNVYTTDRGNLETSVNPHTPTNISLLTLTVMPICHKKPVIRTLLTRAECLPFYDSKEKERQYLFSVFMDNGYPKPRTFVALLMKRILASHNVKVAHKPFQTLRHIFSKPKDRVLRKQRTDSVYCIIHCKDCEPKGAPKSNLSL